MNVAKVLAAFILSSVFLVTTNLADEAKHFLFIAKRTVEDAETFLHRDVLIARPAPTGAWLNWYLVRQATTGPEATTGNNNWTCPRFAPSPAFFSRASFADCLAAACASIDLISNMQKRKRCR